MKRTLPWALLAFFPLASLIAVSSFEPESSVHLVELSARSGFSAFLLRYWWAMLFVIITLPIAWFFAAALRNRDLPRWLRALWLAAMVLFGPVAVPAYWWVHSVRS